jgi:hypothetical protein
LSAAEPDVIIVTAVREVLNRFGPSGLRELINLASEELRAADAAMTELAEQDLDGA